MKNIISSLVLTLVLMARILSAQTFAVGGTCDPVQVAPFGPCTTSAGTSAANRYALVSIFTGGGIAPGVVSVTWQGSAMTKIADAWILGKPTGFGAGDGEIANLSVWRLIAPNTGSIAISDIAWVNQSGVTSSFASYSVWSNVDQTTPEWAVGSAQADFVQTKTAPANQNITQSLYTIGLFEAAVPGAVTVFAYGTLELGFNTFTVAPGATYATATTYRNSSGSCCGTFGEISQFYRTVVQRSGFQMFSLDLCCGTGYRGDNPGTMVSVTLKSAATIVYGSNEEGIDDGW